jgi:hypothetical protein
VMVGLMGLGGSAALTYGSWWPWLHQALKLWPKLGL